MMPRILILVLGMGLAMADAAWAADEPAVDALAKQSALVVLCQVEKTAEGVQFRLRETWKGTYLPESFRPAPREGYLPTSLENHAPDARPGQQFVVFYVLSPIGVNNMDLCLRVEKILPVLDGHVAYGGRLKEREAASAPAGDQRVAVEELKRVVEQTLKAREPK